MQKRQVYLQKKIKEPPKYAYKHILGGLLQFPVYLKIKQLLFTQLPRIP